MSDVLLGLAAGLAAGLVMTRWGLCFNRALRQAAFERRPALLRAFAIAVAAQLLLLPLLIALGVDTLERSADAGGPALLPVAQLTGGLVFGAGMALAGGCVTGMMWKAGSGAVALAVAIAGFAAGELLIRGPGDELIATLDDAARADESSLAGLLGAPYEPVALVLGVAALAALLVSGRVGLAGRIGLAAGLARRRGLTARLARRHRGVTARLVRRRREVASGVALGAVAAATWVAADAAGYGYGLGFVGAADGTRAALEQGGALPFQLWLALGVVLGGVALGDRRLRLPDGARSARPAAGGLLMGAGGSVAHGCNIGHGLTGVPLLSLGSLLATASMAAGALLAWRLVLATRPRLRGRERIA